eukprot:TRINITY_DN621_c0_g2_i1.p3 TRINITY_DN621_c0_g2~~TRINITY_DN621_c0_g2_i1.p3  ORF type:complete len:131 (-),score=21.60 TRINITY_DN621_c0_g2_i1:352-744(-)
MDADFKVFFILRAENCQLAHDAFKAATLELVDSPGNVLELIDWQQDAAGTTQASFVLHKCHDSSGRPAPEIVRQFAVLVDLQSALLNCMGTAVRIGIQQTPYSPGDCGADVSFRPVGVRVPPPAFLQQRV